MEALIPKLRFDTRLVKEMDTTIENFKAMRAEVLLQGGEKSPAYLRDILDALSKTLPHVERVEYPGLDHDGPIEGSLERISKELRAFFSTSLL